MKAPSAAHNVQTRGIRVDKRPWSVEPLENAITFGRLRAILDATLKACDLKPAQRMLDAGCGTGRLAIKAARSASGEAEVFGIDATPAMIKRARANAQAANVNVHFDIGVIERLPFDDASLDVVSATFLFHHLPLEVKRDALNEIRRVLKTGGRLVVADYSRPHGWRGQLFALPMRLDFYEYVRPQLRGLLEQLLAEYFGPVEVVQRFLAYIPILRVWKI